MGLKINNINEEGNPTFTFLELERFTYLRGHAGIIPQNGDKSHYMVGPLRDPLYVFI